MVDKRYLVSDDFDHQQHCDDCQPCRRSNEIVRSRKVNQTEVTVGNAKREQGYIRVQSRRHGKSHTG